MLLRSRTDVSGNVRRNAVPLLAPVFLALVFVPGQCFANLNLCSVVARNSAGEPVNASCSTGSTQVRSSITGAGRQLDIDLLNYAYGGAYTDDPADRIEAYAHTNASVSRRFVVSGGAGRGELLLGGFSDFGSWLFEGGVRYKSSFESNFLPDPVHYTFWGSQYNNPITVPFTFGVPFNLNISSDLQFWSDPLFTRSWTTWEAIHQWEAHLEDILDSSGRSSTSAYLSDVTDMSPVPEPQSIALLLAAVAGLAISLRRRQAAERISACPDRKHR